MNEAYKALGVSENVLAFSETILSDLKDRFAAIDAIAEANQLKVIAAMQKNRVAANHFNLSTGYGYDDEGRDTLERVYADCFGAEAALVRPQITCGDAGSRGTAAGAHRHRHRPAVGGLRGAGVRPQRAGHQEGRVPFQRRGRHRQRLSG